MGFCRKGWLRCDDSKHAKPRNFSERKKHAQSAAPTGAYFLLIRKFPKGKRFYVLFASAKRTKKQPGLRPATSVQNSMEKYFSWHFLHSSLNRYMVRRAFSDVLNRCERVIVVQTQDRYFPKLGCRTASSQGHVTFKKGSCSLSLLR